MMFCFDLAGARDSAELTRQLLQKLEIWGSLALLAIFVFVLCLAQVTRYRRSLPDKRSRWANQ
jgi:hypothetical protein